MTISVTPKYRRKVAHTPIGKNHLLKLMLELIRGNCSREAPDAMHPEVAEAQHEIATICADCPVRLECLVVALDGRETSGVWGGKTDRERTALKKRNPHITSWADYYLSGNPQAALN